MKYRPQFPKEERNHIRNARPVRHPKFQESRRSHHRIKPYDKPLENRYHHRDKKSNHHEYQSSRESNLERKRSSKESHFERNGSSRESHLERNKRSRERHFERERREYTSKSHPQDQISRAGIRIARHSNKDNLSSYRKKASREDHEDRFWLAAYGNSCRDKDTYIEMLEGGDVSRSDEWIVIPSKNSKEENDDLAAKIFTVLLDKGGKLKKKELEACLRAKPLTMRFEPKESFSRFLEVYKIIFDISDVSNDEEEEGEITDPEVRARSDIQICIDHTSSSKACRGDCNDLHICKFKLISDCPFENCRFGHDLQTDHNSHSLKHHFMQFLNPEQVRFLISDLEHRKGVTIPSICTYYNNINECNKPMKCPHLHVCAFIAGKCAFQPNCKRSHNLEDDQPKKVLSKFGIEIDANNKERLLKMLGWGSLHFPDGQGQVASKITHPYRHNGSVKSVKTDLGETEDTQEEKILEPCSEFDERPRYWNMSCMTKADLSKDAI